MKRFFKTLVLTFLFLLGLAYILLQSSPVQNYIIKIVASSLEEKFGTKVHIGHIDIDFFHAVQLDDILICDMHQDTIVYSGSLKLDVNDLDLSENKIKINFILLKDANIKLQRHKEDRRWAYLMFLDNFKTKNKNPSSNQNDWIVDIGEIKLENCIFQYYDEHARKRLDQFDETNIRMNQIYGSIDNLKTGGDSTSMEIKNLTAKEQCGFTLSNLKSLLSISPNQMNFSELHILTPFSEIKDQFIMRFDSLEDFDDFISNVKLEAHFDKSIIAFDDLQYFASELRGRHQKIILSGVGKGPVDNLKCKNVVAVFGKESYFKGNASFKGLPDVYETFFDINTKDALLNKRDLEYLLGEQLPEEVVHLGKVNYQMKAIGFLRDFVLEGDFNTAEGNIRTDINLKFPKDKIESYSGTAFFKQFKLGKLTGNNLLEEVSGSISVNGSGLSIKTINTKIDANLKSILLNKYNYQNITAHGTIANKLFTGKALVADPNLNLDFDGTIDYSKEESIFDFNAKIINANLKVLNLDSSNSVLNAEVQMKLHGNNISNIMGTATIPYISYSRNGKKYEFKKFDLVSTIQNSKRLIKITSDVLDVEIDGNYNFNNLAYALENECDILYPDYFKHYENISRQDFIFKINLKKPEEFISLLNSKLNLKPTTIDGYFNSTSHSYAFNVTSERISYSNYIFDSVDINSMRKPSEPFRLNCTTKRVRQNEGLLATQSKIVAVCRENRIETTVDVFDKTTFNKLKIEGIFDFINDGIALQLNNSEGTISSVDFNFIQKEPIFLNKEGARFYDFKIKSSEQEIVLNGKLSKNPTDQLNFNLHDFQLNTLNSLVKNMGVRLYGEVNGVLSVTNPFNNPYFATDSAGIAVKYFQVDNDTFGNLTIYSAYNKNENIIYSSVHFTDGDLQNVSMEGKIYPNKKTNYLDFNILMKETPTKVLNFVFKGIVSQLEGTLTGKAKLTGSFDKPEIDGKANLKDGGFTIDYLKTHYRLDNEIIIRRNSFEFKNVKLYDENKRMALANGIVKHNNFKNWAIDIDVRNFSNFKILNTNSRDNDLFYGIGYASGNVSMTGPVDNIKMVLNLKSNRGTQINIPLSNPEYSSKTSYITFKEKTQKAYKKYQVLMSGLELEMNLDINEDAYIKLIIDSQLGDIIEGTGNGIINMTISPTGDFSMYGYYEIEHGRYVFTKYDVFNKPFIIKSGGRITWDGDPYAARLDLEAVYNIAQANASSLLASQTTTGGSTPGTGAAYAYIPVDCILYLKGLLFKPDISFNLEIPKLQNFNNPQLENTVKTYIASWQSNPDELNRQVFSLLFFKRFFPLDNAAAGFGYRSGINTSLGDLLTSQLTNWLGQVFTNNPIGIDYTKTDQSESGIWIFKLSKKFFKDRLVLEGNYVYDGSQSDNVTGNISAQVLLDKSGQLRFTVFSKRANNTFTYNQNVLTNGAGFFWRREFNSFRRKKKAPPFSTLSSPN